MNEALNNIYTRVSVRKFTDQKVEKEKIDNILKAAMAAPSAVNRQPWDFIVIDDIEVLNKLAKALPYAKMTNKASFAIAVCGNLRKTLPGSAKDYWVQDCSSATTNILLAVHAQGLGAVWTGVFNGEKKVESVQEILELPKHVIPLNIIPIGYPVDLNTKENNRFKEKSVHYNKW
jgi:nitroreductase